MRRDMDLVRELLLKLEALPMGYRGAMPISLESPDVQVEGYDATEIGYHLDQIVASGFVDTGGYPLTTGIWFSCLTPQGHDFLDSVRDPETWKVTKMRAEKIGGWTLGLVADLAKAYIKAKAVEHGFL